MGQRANIALVRGESYRLFYDHHIANSLPEEFFWGPEHAIAITEAMHEVEPNNWLDEVWAEGGAVIDPDRKTLLLYGGGDIEFDVPLRRLFLSLMMQTWSGWEIAWAHEGIGDLVDRVGFPRQEVLVEHPGHTYCNLEPPEERDWTTNVGAVILQDGERRLFPLAPFAEDLLLAGPKLLKAARKAARKGGRLTHVSMDEWSAPFPSSGFVVDTIRKTVQFWLAYGVPQIEKRIASRWPGFTVVWHRDRFESQLEALGASLRFPARSQAELIREVSSVLLWVPRCLSAEDRRWLMEYDLADPSELTTEDARSELIAHREAILTRAIRDARLNEAGSMS